MFDKKEFTELFNDLYDKVSNISVAVVYMTDTSDIIYANAWPTRLEADLDAQVETFKAYVEHDCSPDYLRGFVLDCSLDLTKIIRIGEIDGVKTLKMDINHSVMGKDFRQNLLDYLEDKIVDSLYDDCN